MSSVLSRGKKFAPMPEKKGRNLRQIEEQFRMLDDKEKRINEYYDERKLNVGRPMDDHDDLSFIMMASANVNLQTSNFWDVIKEKQEATSSKYHDMKLKESGTKKTRKLIEVPDTLVHYRSPLHIQQIEKKKAFLKTSTPTTPTETKPNHDDTLQNESTTNSEGISLMDRTALEDVDRSQESSAIPSPVFKVTSSYTDLNQQLAEVFAFEIRVHQLAEHPNALFDVKIYDELMPIERVTIMKDLRINRDCFIIFNEPSMIKFNALTLPWVESPDELINQTLVVEVQGTYPSKTRTAKSSIKFSHKSHHEKPKIQIPPLRDASFLRSRSPSPTQREKSNKSLLTDLGALPFSTSPAHTNEEELKRSLSCQSIPHPPSARPLAPIEEVDEDAIQRKLERMNSLEGPLSPSAQRYRELQFMRENMKLNLKLHQKLLS
ncbi:hypothetical protein C9374_000075 [Naegleria lovaniensis]|uniref:Uncharacterized protein n=1 Tax=Naegleria lovaniensis TaxID=51637 RepID=A0AA88GUG8_NAELO|nr:uncharacterized protein C9374_000075 [Naegleria lovaniensis]KAG2388636.1 hypothetical protein C9374_000075 [Naegleria lovaniensis]